MAGLAGQPGQQSPAKFRLSAVLRQRGPALPLLLQPAVRIGVALDLAVQLQHQILQAAVVPPKAKAVRQLGLSRRHTGIEALQHAGQNPLPQQLRFPLVQHTEIRCQSALLPQIQQVNILTQQSGTERINGLDVRLVHQQQLPLEMAVPRVLRHAASQLLSNALPQLGGGGPGVGDDEKIIQICLLLPQHPAEQPLHQYPGLAAARSGGNQHPSAPVLHHRLLALCQLDAHGVSSPPISMSILPQNSSGFTGRRGLRRSPPSPSVKWQAEANSQ